MTPPTHRRGGQPRNRNTLKHGLTARVNRPTSHAASKEPQALTLQNEIAINRQLLNNLIDLAPQMKTLPEALDLIRAVSLATSNINRLIKNQYWLNSTLDDPASQAINAALKTIALEWRLGEDNPPSRSDRGTFMRLIPLSQYWERGWG